MPRVSRKLSTLENFWCLQFSEGWQYLKIFVHKNYRLRNSVDVKIFQFTGTMSITKDVSCCVENLCMEKEFKQVVKKFEAKTG